MGKKSTYLKYGTIFAMAGLITSVWIGAGGPRGIDLKKGQRDLSESDSSFVELTETESRLGLSRAPRSPLAGILVEGHPPLVRSPYVDDGPLINVQGLSAGTLVECPSTGRVLRVPDGAEMDMTVEKFMTRRYLVPAFFASLDWNGGGDGAAPDPFAEDARPIGEMHSTACEILKGKGIELEAGASAYYESDLSQLVVTTTPQQLDVIDQFVANLIEEGVPKHIKVTVGPILGMELRDDLTR